jgi:D-alanine--poly(phosphoribitol) ligase subunit 2
MREVRGERILADTNAITQRLGALFVESFHIEVPSAETDLFETGMLDSLQLVELLLRLEQHFTIRIAIDDIDLDDLRTLAGISRVVAANVEVANRAPPRASSRLSEPGAANAGASVSEIRARNAEPRVEGAREVVDGIESAIRRAPAVGRR